MLDHWYLIIPLIWIIITACCVSADMSLPPLGVLVVGIVILHFFSAIPVMAFIYLNLSHIAFYLVLYLVVGVAWSFFKWYKFLLQEKYWKVETFSHDIDIPKATEHKDKIATWTIYWIFSLIGYIAGDLVNEIYRGIFKFFENQYDKVAKKVFSDATTLQEARLKIQRQKELDSLLEKNKKDQDRQAILVRVRQERKATDSVLEDDPANKIQ